MNDQSHPPSDETPDESSSGRPNLAFLPIGITFMMLGVIFMATPYYEPFHVARLFATLDSITLGLVFLPVGVVFIAVSLQEGDGDPQKRKARKDGGDGTIPHTASDTDDSVGDGGGGGSGDGGGGD